MKTSRYTEAQFLAILRLAEGGMPVAEYGGMDAALISQMKAIKDENLRSMRMYANLSRPADLLNCERERHWSE